MSDPIDDHVTSARIPSDISRSDKIVGPFTARQAAFLAVGALVLYGGWWLSRPYLDPLAYAALVIPIAGTITAIALGRREGVDLDRFLLAAVAHARTPKRRVHAPESVGPLPDLVPTRMARAAGRAPAAMRMPHRGVAPAGVLDLRSEGKAALATCSTVNFELRSGAEQQALTAAFARWLNSLTVPTQLLVRCHRVDLTPLAGRLHEDAAALPHPALEHAARAHADFLAQLATGRDLLARQVVLVAREPAPARGAARRADADRALQRINEADRALAAAEITVTALDGPQSAELITSACNPDTPAAVVGCGGCSISSYVISALLISSPT
ncbi:PrgI family protein [Streptomyces sp. HUAS MG91]|uniref:PrgI family protein n=1 Tax=Streptomyces tabacisoli TaxID=3156398 RepID=A0AAU8INI9_9ACTN